MRPGNTVHTRRSTTAGNAGVLWEFIRMMEGLAAGKAEPQTIMIDATYLKVHRTASSLRLKKGIQAV